MSCLRRTLVCMLSGLVATALGAAPRVPGDDAAVLAKHLPGGARYLGEMARLQKALNARPTDEKAAVALAWACVERAELEDSPRWLRFARHALAPWWEAQESPYEVSLLRARLLWAAQELDLAQEELTALLQVGPEDGRGWRMRADIQYEQGDYAGAFRNCLFLVQADPGLPASLCICRASQYSFQAEKSLETLRSELAKNPEAPLPQRVEARRVMAGVATRLKRTAEAERLLREILEENPEHAATRGDLAELLLEANRAGEVPALLKGRHGSTRNLLLHVLAARALDESGDPALERVLRSRLAAARATADAGLMELEARYMLEVEKDAGEALWLAEGAWALRRSPAAARIFLEAARRAGKPDAARPVAEWVGFARVKLPWLVEAARKLEREAPPRLERAPSTSLEHAP